MTLFLIPVPASMSNVCFGESWSKQNPNDTMLWEFTWFNIWSWEILLVSIVIIVIKQAALLTHILHIINQHITLDRMYLLLLIVMENITQETERRFPCQSKCPKVTGRRIMIFTIRRGTSRFCKKSSLFYFRAYWIHSSSRRESRSQDG
jgi:hypothetical protein